MAVKKILTILDPNIELDEMVLVDRTDKRFQDLQDPSKSNQTPDEQNTGGAYPFITIRSIAIELDELNNFEIVCSNTLPELNLTIADKRSRLTNVDFPLDGDLISVYIRPNDDTQKSIRMDFDIETVSRYGQTPVMYNFSGQLRIPKIFDEISESKLEMSSFEAIIDICDSLNLGFATNSDDTNDIQNWILGRDNKLNFIRDIIQYSYLNDDSFFYGFVDHNYFYNFINVQDCFSEDDELDEAIITMPEQTDRQKGYDNASSIGPLLLSNSRNMQGSNMYISYYNPFTNSGLSSKLNGYRRYVQFYDSDEDEFVEEYIEPMITKGNENKILLKGRKDETFIDSYSKYKYMGRQSSGGDGNVHPNYLFARILNHQNLEEIQKAGLDIEIPSLNTDILRFKRIPIVIYDSMNIENKYTARDRDQEENDDPQNIRAVHNEQDEVRNEFLSGFYVCWSFTISWSPQNRYITKAKLLRREWSKRGTGVGVVQKEPS